MNVSNGVCLAVTCHDPLGRFAPGVAAVASVLPRVFDALAVAVTSETHPATLAALEALPVPTLFAEHGAGTIGIGTARRDALALALRSSRDRIFYSDLDHVLRWLATSPGEVEACLSERGHDLVVVGRSPAAMAAAPERLRATEELVNRVFALAIGLEARWDLMIAMRLLTRQTARLIVAETRETSIANDVAWPLLVRARGGTLGYAEADGIRFLARDDFGQDADRRDHDPREWHQRLVTAATHVAAIAEYRPGEP